MWVVKIGGSLLGSRELARWLELIVKFSDGKVIIVPGGGLFADAVRDAQTQSNLNDHTAHKLAVLAMDQFGLLLAGLNPGLATASSELEIAERTWQHRGIVWLPSQMVLADDTIPQNWDVTSDSLSAWLANKIGAEQLVLVKSRQLPPTKPGSAMPLQKLMEEDLIDKQFIEFATGQNYKIWALNKADCHLFEQGLSLQNLEEKGLHINITLH